jgi:signal transduction histidine kinase
MDTAQEHRLARLRRLTEVSRALTYATSIDEVLSLAVTRAAELTGATRALIMLADEDGVLVVRASHGIDAALVKELRAPLHETLIARLQALLGYPLAECFISVPLVVQGDVTGLLAAVRAADEQGNEDDEWLLSALADQAAVALENARLNDSVRAERDSRARAVAAHGRSQALLGHELRSPLNAIQSYSALLLDGIFGPLNDRQRESVARIRRSGQHLLGVIESVANLVKIDGGVVKLTIADVPVADVVKETVQMLQPFAISKGQEVRADTTSRVIVRADANAFRQALVNLIDNAIKYTGVGGHIQVEIRDGQLGKTRCAAVAVGDNGRGIAPELLDAVFEPYERAGTQGHEPGLGLGLYLTRAIARQMGGDIEAQSRPGVGSTFTLLLPLAEP